MNEVNDMRRLVLAGSYAQYRDYLVRENLRDDFALYIDRAEQLRALSSNDFSLVLVGDYAKNPAYQSREYWAFRGYELPRSNAV